MTDPYYSDEVTTIYHGDCLDVLPDIAAGSVAALLTDPPYYNVLDVDWDTQWTRRTAFVSWMGEVLDTANRSMTTNSTAWVFASPDMVSTIESQVVAPRMRVLNVVRWAKSSGQHQKAEVAKLRSYLSAWEGIIFAEQAGVESSDASKSLRGEIFAPLGAYLRAERARAGLTRKELAHYLSDYKNHASATANVFNWELGKNLPRQEDYAAMAVAMNAQNGGPYMEMEYSEFSSRYHALSLEYENKRRPFFLNRKTGPVEDIWNYAPVTPYPGKHPCEKPLPMLEHMVTTSTRPGDTVLDPFMGSGSTLVAANNEGRKAIGVELDERYCEIAANRLAQNVLDFGGVSRD